MKHTIKAEIYAGRRIWNVYLGDEPVDFYFRDEKGAYTKEQLAYKYKAIEIDGLKNRPGITVEEAKASPKARNPVRPRYYCENCKAYLGDGHDCDNCAFCGI
jgi:hypothetical protein